MTHLVAEIRFSAPYRTAYVRCTCGELVLPGPRQRWCSEDRCLADAFAAHRRAAGCGEPSTNDSGLRLPFFPSRPAPVVNRRAVKGAA